MKYKAVSFNMTLAKRISDGSVQGRIRVIGDDDSDIGFATFKSQRAGNYYFFVEGTDDNITLAFNENGYYNSRLSRCHLVLEIPTEGSCDDDVDAAIDYLAAQQAAQQKDTHYHKCKIEPIEYILANNLGFCEGNVVKYITRYKDKGNPLDDLRKIKVYVDYLIEDLTKQQDGHQ